MLLLIRTLPHESAFVQSLIRDYPPEAQAADDIAAKARAWKSSTGKG